MAHLRDHLGSSGLEVLSQTNFAEDNITRKLKTDDHAMGVEDLLPGIADLLAKSSGELGEIESSLKSLVESAMKEREEKRELDYDVV